MRLGGAVRVRRRTIGLAALIAALSLSLPAGAQAVGRSFWGVEIAGKTARDFNKMRRGRVGIVRLGLYQGEIQSAGGYNWSAADQIIGDLASRGIPTLPRLLVSQANPPPPIGSAGARQRWKQFVHAAAARYKPRGSYWSGPYHSQHPNRK